MAQTRKLLAEFAEFLLPERGSFNQSWSRFLETWRRAGLEEERELLDFLTLNLPVCCYATRAGGMEFLGGELLAWRVRCFAWCFKHIGAQKLPAPARDWCQDVARTEASGGLGARGLEDILSAKFAIRTVLGERAAPAKVLVRVGAAQSSRGEFTHSGASFPSRLCFSLLSA